MKKQSKKEFLDKVNKIIEDCYGYLPQTNCWGLSLFYYDLNPELAWIEEKAEDMFLDNFTKKDLEDIKSGDLLLVRNKLKGNELIHSAIFIDENTCFHKWGAKRPHCASLQSIIVFCKGLRNCELLIEAYEFKK